MYKFTTGLIAGSIITAAGITCMMNNNKTKRKIMKAGHMMADKAEDIMDDMSHMW